MTSGLIHQQVHAAHGGAAGFDSQAALDSLCNVDQRACFEINFSGTQEGSVVSS